MLEVYMVVGFVLAAYSIIANDAIQTLGTFISSNSQRPWWTLWLFASSVLIVVLFYGWYASGVGDASYQRLDKIPFPESGLNWLYIIPPLVILILTRFSIPVSTTFLVLTIFAPSSLGSMLTKSLMGYVVAFIVGILVYRFVIKHMTEYFDRTAGQPAPQYWLALQWLSTAFLWSQWLIQDLANIFVYLPRQVSLEWMIFATFVFVALLGFIFYRSGGAIQKIVTSKTGTTDIRAATIIDFIYAIILLVFKEWSHVPMSTTWVFLGLLAGREFAISMHMFKPSIYETAKIVRSDALKAATGLVISIVLALGLPWLYQITSV
ncbi:hypothetical protein NDN11_17280 [Acinetobacter sp. C26M]|uniref:hypothetical protein n=1 Tax=unclassified Acinetobacter TaxID=196816 RepID=UPI002037632E|nr:MULTISPECIES: hypothetical protein [unclassified Acinetobacter]USA46411.1 hypothetical protein NDN11_17280 [Acinetobacter sp. C26M]USA49895.1 hypothetical protein NDN12_17195 [Acinetobacter sp. C26G]